MPTNPVPPVRKTLMRQPSWTHLSVSTTEDERRRLPPMPRRSSVARLDPPQDACDTTLLRAAVSPFPLLDRYVAREVASHAFGGFVVVLAIFLVTRTSTLLSDAAVGSLPGGVLALLLALRTVMALPSLLPAVVYLGVLLAMNR